MKKLTLLFFAVLCSNFVWSQTKITGTVKDANNESLPGANVVEKGTTNGTNTDFDGKFSLTVKDDATLVISFAGFDTQNIKVNGKTNFNIILKEGLELEEVVITGSRTPARSNTSSPLPVDIVSSKDLQATGQATFDKALQYKIPSFNTVQTPVNDATSLLDPYEIRNMGPSRTLILINGKRKNLSSLLYTQTSPGRGETGADISGIPTDAIKTIQILRDGASAQYGSDAIAGVMNIILKDDYKNGSATFRTGITGEGDGEMLGVSVNNGSTIGDDKGFINYTIDFSKTSLANRPGIVDAEGEATDFGANISDVQEFLSRRPDAGNINGSPETAAAKFLINGKYNLTEKSNLYFNAAYVYKKVNSFANYRTPYWRKLSDFPYLANLFPGSNPTNTNGYDGYLPTFEGDLNDYNATLGITSKINDWNLDGSITVGGNQQTYTVNNSHNGNTVLSPNTYTGDLNGNGIVDLTAYDLNGDGVIGINEGVELIQGTNLYRENSPISFKPGGTAFNHIVGNIDISRILSEKVSVGFGAEFRTENFEIIEGDLASYDGGGADSFAGNRPENSGSFNRYNLAGYASLDWDISKNFLLSGTVRAENFSDFGSTFVWKASSRYKFADDKYTLRGSLSTGFRAPTLHQIYTQKSQFSFVPGQGIQIGGLVNNVSPQARLLGIPKLTAEESTNFTVGIGAKPFKNFSFTIDYYDIRVDDRIVLSTELTPPNEPAFAGLSDVSFFVNAIDTKTSGLDFVFGYKNIELGTGKLSFNLSGNYTITNERVGKVKNPNFATNSNQSVVNATQEALFFTSRPKTKWILGTTYDIGKFGFSLNNTYFGKTTFKQQGLDSNLRTEFTPNIVTDLGINFNATEKVTIAFNINNLLNVLPEWNFKAENANGQNILNDPIQVKNQSNLITFNQRYAQTTYDGSHFSQLGTMFNLSLNYRF
ncbi:TonB-dependent outer membrane receptor [Tenacibaculum maritimum]|uniref:TonB-dependent receptor n=1 Tax=Tenacibaculum maritimum TaxID=107401 RepID=UPI0012E4140A|nr:TonB-dependent receptor [Tenacibaculum maritimum]CAA0195669.1 TonB-dependent outer membrane receptor [Tenacibaculum maritimum]